jgi:predicted O-methyltransferase YrrM
MKNFIRRWTLTSKPSTSDEEDMQLLSKIHSLDCNDSRLIKASSLQLSEILNDEVLAQRWRESLDNVILNDIPDAARAINPGDRRALHHLIDHFKPKRVLEVGTHIGASTSWIASLLSRHMKEDGLGFQLTTVDIKDVNSESDKYWLKFGSAQSPRERMRKLGVIDRVHFVAQDSLDYFANSKDEFDFVFLDGNHRASHVYREIPMLLERLTENGVILMHDYFPDGKPLWPQEPAIIGPYEAVLRHRKEGKPLVALPLGALPWETKYGSNTTSLALLLKED